MKNNIRHEVKESISRNKRSIRKIIRPNDSRVKRGDIRLIGNKKYFFDVLNKKWEEF